MTYKTSFLINLAQAVPVALACSTEATGIALVWRWDKRPASCTTVSLRAVSDFHWDGTLPYYGLIQTHRRSRANAPQLWIIPRDLIFRDRPLKA